jgi:hypothetical protein
MQLSDGVCQKHRPLVFLAGLLLVMGYATYVKFFDFDTSSTSAPPYSCNIAKVDVKHQSKSINQSISKILLECGQLLFYICYTIYFIA